MRLRRSRLATGLLCAATLWFAGISGAADLTPEGLLAAALPAHEAATLLPAPADWWPQLPEFYGGTLNANALPGERFYVVQGYARPGDPERSKAVTALTLLESERAAQLGLRQLAADAPRGAVRVLGPVVGDERRYFVRTLRNGLHQTTLRFREGPVLARVSITDPSPASRLSHVAAVARALDARIRAALHGGITPPALPTDWAALMPPADAAPGVGPLLGTALVPVESWALIDDSAPPMVTRDRLAQGGAAEVCLQRLAVNGLPGHAVEAVLWRFATPRAAQAWVAIYAGQTRRERLPFPGGSLGSPFAAGFNEETQLYEVQFARGCCAASVSGFAPFADRVDPRCADAVRGLAVAWFQALPDQ